MILSLLALVAALSTIAAAKTTVTDRWIVEVAPDTGPWLRGEKAAPLTVLQLQIKLPSPRAAEFEQHVLDVSTPGHGLYGKHLTREQVNDFVRPSEESIETVLQWLEQNDITSEKYSLTKAAGGIDLEMTVDRAENMFDADFYTYSMDGQSIIRAEQYSLPNALKEHVINVMPIIRFPEISPHINMIFDIQDSGQAPPSLGYDPEFCNHTITPACLQGLYQMNNYTAPQDTGTMIGVSGFLNQTPLIDDLHDFIAAYAPYSPQVFPELVTTDNSKVPDAKVAIPRDSQEASLDLQYTSSMAPGIPLTWYTTSGLAASIPDLDTPPNGVILNEPYQVQLQYLLSLPNDKLPSVLSTSYGESEQTVPLNYKNNTCQLFAQLTARGVSIIFSSGDTGPGSACTSNDGLNRPLFSPIFPATCPFVTSVGGTTGVEPEVAAKFSSGGFSNHWLRPDFQDSAVREYLEILGDRFVDYFPARARAFPDVAVQSSNFVIRDHGRNAWVSGTSAGAPVFAGMIANLNAARLDKGLPVLGWLNPWLYGEAREAFTDIVHGGSRGCTGRAQFGRNATYIPYAGWNATKGWDPVTGLGTPIWPKLLEIALRPEPASVDDAFVSPTVKGEVVSSETAAGSVSGTG